MVRSTAEELVPVFDGDGILAVTLQGVELPFVGCEVGPEGFQSLGGFGCFFWVRFLTKEGAVGVKSSVE